MTGNTKGAYRRRRPLATPQTWRGGPCLPPPMGREEFLEHVTAIFGDAERRGVWPRAARYFGVGLRTLCQYGHRGAWGNRPVPVDLNLALRTLRAQVDR